MIRPVLKKPDYKPEWKGVFESYSKAWTAKQFWRVQHVLGSHEDSLQECAMVWSKCAATYTGKVDNPAWFMALFKVALARHWHSLACQDTANPNRYINQYRHDETQVQDEYMSGQVEHHHGFVACIWHNMTDELKQVFFLLQNAPSEVLDIVFNDVTDAQLNKKLCRLLRFSTNTDVVAELRQLFTS
jgi:hypothetical protein